MRVLDILDSLGYAPITSHANSLLYTSIKKALERNMEKQFVPILIEKLCSIARLTDNELLTNYDLFENSLFKLFDSRRFLEIVLHWVKIEMLTESVLQDSNITVEQILDPRLTINDILLHISSEQVNRFIQNLPAHRHIAYCYQSKQSKDKALTAFFNPTVTKDFNTGLISLEPFTPKGTDKDNLKVDTSLLYTQVFSHAHKDKITKRQLNWVYFAHGSPPLNPVENKSRREGYNKPENKQRNQIPAARVASEDDSWFFRNGFQREILEAEESLGRSVKDNISCMCMYDILNVNDEGSLRSLIKSHSHVIVDYPYMIYAAGGEANVN